MSKASTRTMDRSRLAKCSEPNCGTLVYNGTNHKAYPQAHNEPNALVPCPMENCKWIGEAHSYEEHRLKKHPRFIAEPVPLTDATHIVVPKEDHEKLQDELGKLTHEVDQSKKLEFEKEKEWREAKEARERHESNLMNCCRRISSQSPKNVDAVIQRSVAANQQVQANSTASLGRAEQLPQQEHSRTLDAEGSDFQQFFSVFEQEGDDHEENYEQPQSQSEQQSQSKEALVVAPINIPTQSESPPPLPPKPKQDPQMESLSADLIPPKLPPKPNSNRGPPTLYPRNQETLATSTPWSDVIPPPRPPKPNQAKAAIPQLQRRQKKSPPPPPQDYGNGEGRKEVRPSNATDENMDSTNYGARITHLVDCPNCVVLRESNDQLRKNYDRLKEVLRNQQKSNFNSNTKRKATRSHSE